MNDWDVRSFDWSLTEDSVVVEIGGYKGRWAKEIARLYNPRLYVFEPQQWAYTICKNELLDANAMVFNYALITGVNSFATLGDSGTDGASLLKVNHANKSFVEVKNVLEVFDALELNEIDLLLMNIEGYEFKLLPYMIQTGLLDRVKCFMVQFHLFALASTEYDGLLKKIDLSHRLLWDYGVVLMAWERRQ